MYPSIVKNYGDNAPPFEVEPTVRRALKVVPKNLLGGLDQIVLTNASSLSRRRRRAKTKSRRKQVSIKTCRGLYRKNHIEIFVDNIIRTKKRNYFVRQLSLFRVARTLFHEIGHHIHRTKRPEHREPENVADEYMRFYTKKFIWRNWHRVGAMCVSLLALVITHPKSIWKALRRSRQGA